MYTMHPDVFKGLKITIDISNLVEKQRIQKLVKDNGGEVSIILNKKVSSDLYLLYIYYSYTSTPHSNIVLITSPTLLTSCLSLIESCLSHHTTKR